nr:hypothetical protein [Clostridioides sp.]
MEFIVALIGLIGGLSLPFLISYMIADYIVGDKIIEVKITKGDE